MAHTIRVGKFNRIETVNIYITKRDTRWDPYPFDDGLRHLQTIVLGDVYQWSNTVGWYRTRIQGIPCGPLATEEVLHSFGCKELHSLEKAVNEG